jgi:Tol biopolymer transport system component
VTVRAAHLPGLARVAYSIGAIARTDSVMYTIQPGSPASIRLTPRVGAIRVNDTLRFAAELLDRVQNVVPDTSWAISVDGVVATLEDGTLVRGATLGNALVRATWGTRRDSAELAVVPSGRIAAVRAQSGETPRAVVLRELTGADERVVVSTLGAGFGTFSPFYQPTTGRLAVESGRPNYETGVLWVGDTLGNFEQQSLSTPSLEYQHVPVLSFDGTWLYFTGSTYNVQQEVWRVRIGEDSVERLTAEVGHREEDYHPTPSPDGLRLAYTEWRNEAYALRVMDLSTRTISTLAAGPFWGSRWSPTGEWIAALRQGTLWLIASDGLETRQLEPSLSNFQSPPNWSPDGKWLIVLRAGLQELINIETNVRIRLPNTGLIFDASFVVVR